MYRAYVKHPDGRIQQVKNLGWILRNWQLIEEFEWLSYDRRANIHGDMLLSPGICDGVFRAKMHDGRVYAIRYADFSMWCKFINRPVFRGLRATVNGITGEV